MSDCLFCKIANGEIGELIFEDDDVCAFMDISPQAPFHCLVIPKQHIATLNDLTEENNAVIGKMLLAAKQIAAKNGFAENGYRTVMNCNVDGGQTVFHVHLHLLAGRQCTWPPG